MMSPNEKGRAMPSTLTTGSVPRHLVRLTLPTIGGALAITAFNLTDTYFVSKLGTESLAAMGFTFPVVMVVGAVAMGLSMGSGSVLARATGAGDRNLMKRTATDGLLLSLTITAIVGLAGLLSMNPLFRAMGADESTLPLVKDYMTIWYAGALVIMTPPVGDSNLRATGDMIRPSIVMMICALGNVILDPLFIFGLGPFPAMGMKGAALATVISRTAGMVATLTFNAKAGLLDMTRPKWAEIWTSWKSILFIGIPTAVTQLLPSALRGVLTVMAASVAGIGGVAAIAAGSRVESVPMMVAWSFNSAIITVAGQNLGAGRHDRVDTVRRNIGRFALIYGLIITAVMWATAPLTARIFTDDLTVLNLTIRYLRIYFLSFVAVLVFTWIPVALNAVGKPVRSLFLNLIGIGCLMIPGALIGRYAAINPFTGMIIGFAIGTAFAGIVAWFFGYRNLGMEQLQEVA